MMEKPDVLVVAPLPDFLRAQLEAAYVCHDLLAAADPEEFISRVGGRVRAVVPLGGTVVAAGLLEQLPMLEIVSVMGVGYDGVPVRWCSERGE
jgi:hydroxypyruvate reductase